MEKCKYLKKKNVKNNYRKFEKKEEEDNDVNADMTQLEHGNNKCYGSTFRNI